MPVYDKAKKTYKPEKTLKRVKKKKGGTLKRVAESKGLTEEEYLKSISKNPKDLNLHLYKGYGCH